MSKKKDDTLIIRNKKAQHEYFLEERFEAGLVLYGWEVKSLRAGKINFQDSHIILKQETPWLLGTHITPLATTARHTNPDPSRTRKLLLHKKEIRKLIGLTERKGYTLVPVRLYWKNQLAKIEFAVAKGKKLYDKRETERQKSQAQENAKFIAAYKRRA